MKSHFLEIKWRNLQKIAKFLKNLVYRDKIGVQLCENLHCLKDILIGFRIFFYLMKKSCLVLNLCHFKV